MKTSTSNCFVLIKEPYEEDISSGHQKDIPDEKINIINLNC